MTAGGVGSFISGRRLRPRCRMSEGSQRRRAITRHQYSFPETWRFFLPKVARSFYICSCTAVPEETAEPIVDLLNRGVSVVGIAAREDLTAKRSRPEMAPQRLEKIESAPGNGMVPEDSNPQDLVHGRAAGRARLRLTSRMTKSRSSRLVALRTKPESAATPAVSGVRCRAPDGGSFRVTGKLFLPANH